MVLLHMSFWRIQLVEQDSFFFNIVHLALWTEFQNSVQNWVDKSQRIRIQYIKKRDMFWLAMVKTIYLDIIWIKVLFHWIIFLSDFETKMPHIFLSKYCDSGHSALVTNCIEVCHTSFFAITFLPNFI